MSPHPHPHGARRTPHGRHLTIDHGHDPSQAKPRKPATGEARRGERAKRVSASVSVSARASWIADRGSWIENEMRSLHSLRLRLFTARPCQSNCNHPPTHSCTAWRLHSASGCRNANLNLAMISAAGRPAGRACRGRSPLAAGRWPAGTRADPRDRSARAPGTCPALSSSECNESGARGPGGPSQEAGCLCACVRAPSAGCI